jgi:formylglycine-generating enzyme required for sulfatase activity
MLLFAVPLARAQETPPQQGQEIPPPVAGQNNGNPNNPTSPFGQPAYATPVRSPAIITRLPYTNWRTHSGSAAEAVCLINLGTPDGPASTGLVIRCDGFVLVSHAVLEAQRAGTPLFIRMTGAENEQLSGPLQVAGRLHQTSPRCPYGVLKVNDHHVRCLSLLSANHAKPGVPVQIVTAVPGEKPGLCASTVKGGIVGTLTTGTTGNAGEDAYLIDGMTSGDTPVGAIVVDKETGAAIGIVTGGGPKPIFTTFANLYDICSEVGLAPDRDAVKARKSPSSVTPPRVPASTTMTEKANALVWIPGGAVQLDGAQGEYYRKAFKTEVACTPGFFIDTLLVAQADYDDWARKNALSRTRTSRSSRPLAALPEYTRNMMDYEGMRKFIEALPASVDNSKLAADYAATFGKRLPTEVEWRLATICDDLGWAVGMNATFEGQVRQLYALVQQRNLAWYQWMNRAHTVTTGSRPRSSGRPAAAPGSAPINSVDYANTLRILSQGDVARMGEMEVASTMFMNSMPDDYPWILVPVGKRAQDKSRYGLQDVLMNIPEYVLSVNAKTQLAPKLFPAKADASASSLSFNASATTNQLATGQYAFPFAGHSPMVTSPLAYLYFGFDSVVDRQFKPGMTRAFREQFHLQLTIYCIFTMRGLTLHEPWRAVDETPAQTTLFEGGVNTRPQLGIGFRGAR